MLQDVPQKTETKKSTGKPMDSIANHLAVPHSDFKEQIFNFLFCEADLLSAFCTLYDIGGVFIFIHFNHRFSV